MFNNAYLNYIDHEKCVFAWALNFPQVVQSLKSYLPVCVKWNFVFAETVRAFPKLMLENCVRKYVKTH